MRSDNGVELPSSVELSAASKDLLKRLLEYDPSKRLRALYALKRIAFFKDFSFDDVLSRRVSNVVYYGFKGAVFLSIYE